MSAFLQAGWPLSSLDRAPLAKRFLEAGRGNIPHSSLLCRYIRPVLTMEKDRIKEEICTSNISVIFDGMSEVAEIVAVLFRCVLSVIEVIGWVRSGKSLPREC